MNNNLQNTGNQGSEIELFGKDPLIALEKMEKFVKVIAAKCRGKQFVSEIEGRNYARAEWWSAVGGSLSIFANTDRIENLDNETETKRRAWVQLFRNGVPFGPKASGLCSSLEVLQNKRTKEIKSRWLDPNGRPEEYAIDSMATTRATSKAFRQSMGILPVLAGLEATPAEEMDGVKRGSGGGGILVVCPIHNQEWFKTKYDFAHKVGNEWCNRKKVINNQWQLKLDKLNIDLKEVNEKLKAKYEKPWSGLTDEQKAEVLGDVSIVTGEVKSESIPPKEGDQGVTNMGEIMDSVDPTTEASPPPEEELTPKQRLQKECYALLNEAFTAEKVLKGGHDSYSKRIQTGNIAQLNAVKKSLEEMVGEQ